MRDTSAWNSNFSRPASSLVCSSAEKRVEGVGEGVGVTVGVMEVEVSSAPTWKEEKSATAAQRRTVLRRAIL